MFLRELNIREQQVPVSHTAVVRVMNNVAASQCYQGKVEEAENMLKSEVGIMP